MNTLIGELRFDMLRNNGGVWVILDLLQCVRKGGWMVKVGEFGCPRNYLMASISSCDTVYNKITTHSSSAISPIDSSSLSTWSIRYLKTRSIKRSIVPMQ